MAQADSDNSTPAPAAEKPQDSLYMPTDTTPEQLFRAIGKLRKDARDEIDRLIRFLDETDNHMEREPEDEGDEADAEPSLGSFDRMTDQGKAWQTRGSLWAFPVEDGEQDDADAEPALGSLDGQSNQTAWAAGDRRDLELDPTESGIADLDGLLEQVGTQDWQQGAQG
jgi:hypothetical protein